MTKKYDFSELAELININSYTKNKKGVDLNGKLMREKLEALGYKCEVFKREEIGDHLFFKSPKREGKKILLLGHLDTVFPPMSFEEFREDEEWIYGPGVCDMKGGNFVALEALRNIKREGEIYNIDFLLVSDEETGSDDSKEITAKIALNYDYCMVFEAAGKNGELVVERKGVATFYIDIKGKAAHAGNNYKDGINANLEAAEKLIAITNLTDLSKETTVNVGKIEGGIGANTISPHAKLTVEIRYAKASERDRVLREFYDIVHTPTVLGSESILSGGIQRDVMQSTPKQKEFLDLIEKLTSQKVFVEKRGGVSDANIVASVGVAVIDGFGPFGDGDHTIHERALKKSFIERVEFVTKILKGICQ